MLARVVLINTQLPFTTFHNYFRYLTSSKDDNSQPFPSFVVSKTYMIFGRDKTLAGQ